MRVHVVQLGYADDEPVAARIDRVAALVAAQHDADLVVLPELWAPTGFGYRDWAGRAEPLDGGPTLRAMSDAARACGAAVLAGSVLEAAPGPAADPGDHPGDHPGLRGRWNTAVLLGPDGHRLARYRKIHRFGFAGGEPDLIDAGQDVVTVDCPTRDGEVRLGLALCYDLRFPELFRRLLDAGAEAFAVPAAWPARRVAHWSLLARARAVENQTCMIACNTAGTHARTAMGGRSVVVAADGTVIAEAGDGEQVLVATIDLAAQRRWREDFPVLTDRRPEVTG